MTKLSELADMLGGRLQGNGELSIRSVGSLYKAKKDEIAVLFKETKKTGDLNAAALVVTDGATPDYENIIFVDDPHIALSILIGFFYPGERPERGKSGLVYISPDAEIGEEVIIGDFCRIGRNVKIGKKTVIDPGVVIYPDTEIGSECRIYSNVVIRENCFIGNRVVIQPGAVIGADGFGFARNSGGVPLKIPQVGRVVIGNNCEIGANVCIDRSTLDETAIADNVKIDNLVQIGHNVKVGNSVTISAQSGISGSTKVGDQVVMGGQVGLADHIDIGNNVKIAAKCGVSGNVEDNRIIGGIPHNDFLKWKKNSVIFRNLESYIERIKALEKRVKEMEEK